MRKLKIVVVGTLASDPYAGMAWMHMQMVMGLKRLGHSVYYFETTSTWPYDPNTYSRVDNTEYSIPYLKRVLEGFGFDGEWGYRASFSDKKWYGMSKAKAEDLLVNADIVFNVSGATRFSAEGLKVGRLAYYGTDPVYDEIKYSQGDKETVEYIDEHNDFITYGENIGNSDCPIPALPGLKAKTRQPVLLDFWKTGKPVKKEFTTVGNWKQSGRDLEFRGDTYFWSKHHEFLKFMDLPKRISQPIELAMNLSGMKTVQKDQAQQISSLGVHKDDYSLLTHNGWKLIDAPAFTTDPWRYRDYIFSSRAEFTFAKDQNVRLRSGWFSERSACYLAASRPVITQDTGFGAALPTGEGLFKFTTMEEIIFAIDEINGNYEKHSIAAREIAEEYFRAEKVMEKVLTDLNV